MPYASCHSPNHKSAFPQILHDFSVSWLFIFSFHLKYFANKEPIRVEILRISSAQIKIYQIFYHFWNSKSVFFNFASFFTVTRHNSSILFLDEFLHTFHKRSLSKYKFSEISCEQSKVQNFVLWWTLFVQIT